MSEGELPRLSPRSPSRVQRSDSVVQLSQFYASLNSTLVHAGAEKGVHVDQYNRKASKTLILDGKNSLSRAKLPDYSPALAGNKSSEARIVLDTSDKYTAQLQQKQTYLKMQNVLLSADKQKKSVQITPKCFIADQYKVHSESPIFHNHLTGEEGRSKDGEMPVPCFQKVKTNERNAEVVRWKRQEFPSEDALGTRHDVIALSRWLSSMYSKIPACKAWPPSVSDEEMSSAFERFLATFSKDIFLNSTHPECLNVIVRSAAEQHQQNPIDNEESGEQNDLSSPDEVLMPFRASIEVVDAVAGEIIRQISNDCSERAILLDKVITQYKVVLREAWIMKQRAETEGISGLRSLLKQCEVLLISESKARVVAECSNEHHVIKAQAHERKIQACEKELEQCNVQLLRMRDQIDHCHRQLHDKDNDLECKALFLKDAKAANDMKQLHLENVLMRERQWEDKVRALGSDPNCFLGIDVEVQVDQISFQVETTDVTRLVTPPEVRKARIEKDAYAKSMAQLKKAEAMSLSMKDLQSTKTQPAAVPRSTIVTHSLVDMKSQKEKELMAQQLKEKNEQQLSLMNQTQQHLEASKQLHIQLANSREEVNTLKDSIQVLEKSLSESETQRKKSEADVLILLEETDALQKRQNGSVEENLRVEEAIRDAKANVFKEQLLVKKLQDELESWKENETRLMKENSAAKEHAVKQRAEIQGLNSKLIVLERDFTVATIELKKMQQLQSLEKENKVVVVPEAVITVCTDTASQTDPAENQAAASGSKASTDKLKKAVATPIATATAPAPNLADDGPAHEKIKKATLQLRSDLKKKNEENEALFEKLRACDEQATIQRVALEEKSATMAKLLADKRDLLDKVTKLQSQLEIACRPPAPSEKVVDAVAALQVIGALSQMHSTSNQHEANEKLKRQMSALRDQQKPKLQLSQVLDKPKTPITEPEKLAAERRKAKTPLLPSVVSEKIQAIDEAAGEGDAEIHSENREQVLKLLAAAQGIGKATKKFHRKTKVSDDTSGEATDAQDFEMKLKELEDRCELYSQNNDTLRASCSNKIEEISRLNFQVQKLKDELAVLADQRASWLKDEQKRNHLESSVEQAAQQTKKMMDSIKKGTSGTFQSVVQMVQADHRKASILMADAPLPSSASVSVYVPKPSIPTDAIPYMKFLKEAPIQTPTNPKSAEWLNTFFEDVMACKVRTHIFNQMWLTFRALQVSSDRFDKVRNFYHDDVGDYMFALLMIRLKSLPKALKALAVVHSCADNLRRTSLHNDLIYGILAQRYDNEQAAFYWWLRQEVASGCFQMEDDGTLRPELAMRKLSLDVGHDYALCSFKMN
jgi:hypothetical protein